MSTDGPCMAFEVYRWAGTSSEDFQQHYRDVHAKIGMRIPGLVWYESFMNKHPQEEWPVIGGGPKPDALVVMMFDSEESKAKIAESEAWKEAAEDDLGFCSHFDIFEVDRYTWIPETSVRESYHDQVTTAG